MTRIVRARRFTSKQRETASFWKKISSTALCCVPQTLAAISPHPIPGRSSIAKLRCRYHVREGEVNTNSKRIEGLAGIAERKTQGVDPGTSGAPSGRARCTRRRSGRALRRRRALDYEIGRPELLERLGEALLRDRDQRRHPAGEAKQLEEADAAAVSGGQRDGVEVQDHRDSCTLLPQEQQLGLVVL